jgi:hypothetical protein
MKLEWWWAGHLDDQFDYVSLDVPSRDYAVGLLAAHFCDGPAYEADFLGKVLTGLVLRNYAEAQDGPVTFHARLA